MYYRTLCTIIANSCKSVSTVCDIVKSRENSWNAEPESEKWKVKVKSEKWKVKVKTENFENLRVWSLACWASNQINQSSLVTIAPPAATSNENLEQMEENSAHQIVFRSSKFLHHLQTVLNRFMRPIEQVSRDKPDVGKNILLLSAWESIQPLPSLFWGRISPFQSPELNTPCPTVPPHI